MGNKGQGIDELSGFAMEFIKEAGKQALPFFGKGKPQVKFDQGLVTGAAVFWERQTPGQIRPGPGHRGGFTDNEIFSGKTEGAFSGSSCV